MRTCVVYLGLSLAVTLPVVAQDASVPERLTLADAQRLAEQRSPRLAASSELVEMAKADRSRAGRRPSGVFSVGGEAYPLFEASRPSFWDGQALTFRYDQEIETAGRRGLRLDLSEVDVDRARAGSADERRRLALDVGRAYFQLVLAQVDQEVATAALAELERVIRLTEARFESGEVAGAELRRLRVERLRFVDDVLSAELQARNAQAALLGLLNVLDLTRPLQAVDSLAAPPLVTADGRVVATPAGVALELADLRDQALAARPDLRQVELERTRAETAVRHQRALRTPNITAGWGYRRHFGSHRMEFGVAMPVPLLGGLNPGGVERAEAGRRRVEALVEVALRALDVELQQAVNAVEINVERVRYVEEEYVVAAEESLEITRASYELGAADLIDFLDAQRAFRETQRVRNQALYSLRMSLFELASAVGLSGTRL